MRPVRGINDSSSAPAAVLPFVLWFAASVSGTAAEKEIEASDQQFEGNVLPLLKKHCFGCHGPDKQEGKLKLSDFANSAAVAAQPHIWQRVLERLQAGDMPPEDALNTVVDSPFTRYPVYRGSLDEIIGVLHVRDLFGAMHDLGMASVSLEAIVRPAYVVPETKDLAALLADFRREKQHMAIVVDEYGDVDGIVTLEDVLEEIVGEIEDEFDLPDTSIERIDENRIRIDGTYTIDDFNEEFGTELEQEDFHTMAGLVFGELGRAPEVGDTVNADGLRLSVLEVEGSRILKIEVEFGVDETPTDEPAAA